MIAADLDHLAVAAESQHDCWPRYIGDLGGAWLGGGATFGFASYQVTYANGMKLEVLEPANVDKNDFLRRFLDHRGPGPHHVTFKVPDIEDAMAQVTAAGFDLVGVDTSDPGWKEAFIHPKQGFGIVVQLAQSDGQWEPPGPGDDVPAPAADQASFDRVVHAVADLDACLGLFEGLLGGRRVAEGEGFVELGWPGPGRIRFVAATTPELQAHIGGADGRLLHLAMSVDDPTTISDAVADGDVWRIAPETNLGVPVQLSRR